MAKKRGRKKGSRRKKGFSGLQGTPSTAGAKATKGTDRKQITYTLLSFAGGAALGAILDKPAGPLGIVTGAYGIWKKNPYIASAGAGLLIGNAGRFAAGSDVTNVKEYIKSAPERAKGFIKAIGEKLFIPVSGGDESGGTTQTDQGTSGLHGNDKVTYFINPYTRKPDSIDMSELDKIHEQVKEMNGMGAIDPTERNF